ncbi:hypothetical protein K8R20_02835 [bacterium]|nr:hypothetical protein [bacterium]
MIKQKLRLLAILPILTALFLCGFITQSSAAQFETGDYSLEQSEIIEENLYVSDAQSVTIDGVIDGDLFIGAEVVTISGTVTGDVYVGARSIDISGNIYGNTFLAAQYVDISGSVAQNTTIATMSSTITGTVGRDLLIFASDSKISGDVMEDVRVFVSSSIISGNIKGESMIFAASSTIDEDLMIGEVYENIGDGKEGEIIEGEDILQISPKTDINFMDSLKAKFVSTVVGFIAMYIVGIVLIHLAPVKTLKIEKKVSGSASEFLYSFLVGLGITFFIPFPLLLLSFTVIGLPLAFVISAGLIFALIFGKLWVESAIGYKILESTNKKDNKRFLSLFIGRGLTSVINFIPVIGTLYKWVLSMVAVGAIARMKYDCLKGKKTTKKVAKKKSKK